MCSTQVDTPRIVEDAETRHSRHDDSASARLWGGATYREDIRARRADMHEMALTQSVVEAVCEHAAGRRVHSVKLEVGACAPSYPTP